MKIIIVVIETILWILIQQEHEKQLKINHKKQRKSF